MLWPPSWENDSHHVELPVAEPQEMGALLGEGANRRGADLTWAPGLRPIRPERDASAEAGAAASKDRLRKTLRAMPSRCPIRLESEHRGQSLGGPRLRAGGRGGNGTRKRNAGAERTAWGRKRPDPIGVYAPFIFRSRKLLKRVISVIKDGHAGGPHLV